MGAAGLLYLVTYGVVIIAAGGGVLTLIARTAAVGHLALWLGLGGSLAAWAFWTLALGEG